jgi:hypothetical protein
VSRRIQEPMIGPVEATIGWRKSVGRSVCLGVCKKCKHHQQQTYRSRRPTIGSNVRSGPLGISTSRRAGSTRPCGLAAYLATE